MGFKIAECRKAAKMSQTELSKKSGVSRATIWALENGIKRATTTSTLIKLAQALEKSVEEIFFTQELN